MNVKRNATAVALALIVSVAAAGVASAQDRASRTVVDQITAGWPETPREVAQTMIGKYGLPHEATDSMLIWHNNGPWKRTIVYREEIPHHFPKPHTDLLEQFVDYRVPVDLFDELAAYDGSVIVERTKGEMSARCDKEGANFLALNLADDIVNGRRSVADARRFYAQSVQAMMEGETPPYMQRLRFSPRTATADPGRPVTPQTMVSGSTAEERTAARRRMPKE